MIHVTPIDITIELMVPYLLTITVYREQMFQGVHVSEEPAQNHRDFLGVSEIPIGFN